MVITIIIIGVLSLTALPRFFRSGFGEASLRDQLIAAMQLVQNQNMHHRSRRFCLQLQSDNYFKGEWFSDSVTCVQNGESFDYPNGTGVSVTGAILFTRLGEVHSDSTFCLPAGCQITVSGSGSASLAISSVGLVYAVD